MYARHPSLVNSGHNKKVRAGVGPWNHACRCGRVGRVSALGTPELQSGAPPGAPGPGPLPLGRRGRGERGRVWVRRGFSAKRPGEL
eukprot:1056831-Prymnesium_polylepis.1